MGSRGKDTVVQSTEYLYYHLLWVDEFCFIGSDIYDFEKKVVFRLCFFPWGCL